MMLHSPNARLLPSPRGTPLEQRGPPSLQRVSLLSAGGIPREKQYMFDLFRHLAASGGLLVIHICIIISRMLIIALVVIVIVRRLAIIALVRRRV